MDRGCWCYLHVSFKVMFKVFCCARALGWERGDCIAILAFPAACFVRPHAHHVFSGHCLPHLGSESTRPDCSIWFFLALQFFNYALANRKRAILAAFSEGWCSSRYTCFRANLSGLYHLLRGFPWLPWSFQCEYLRLNKIEKLHGGSVFIAISIGGIYLRGLLW